MALVSSATHMSPSRLPRDPTGVVFKASLECHPVHLREIVTDVPHAVLIRTCECSVLNAGHAVRCTAKMKKYLTKLSRTWGPYCVGKEPW
jgi:hypothetical protein